MIKISASANFLGFNVRARQLFILMLFIQPYNILPHSIRERITAFLYAVFRSRVKVHFSSFIRPGDLVFDVGTNVGHLTKVFLELGARVISIEPQPSCVEILKKRFANNAKVTIIEKALGDKEGKLPLAISPISPSLATLSNSWQKEGRYSKMFEAKTINVEVTTLDVLIREYGRPVFCKIDVEGFEKEVLLGLNQEIPVISFEFHMEFLNEAKICIERLVSLGYQSFNYSIYETYALSLKEWKDQKQIFKELESKNGLYVFGDIYAKKD